GREPAIEGVSAPTNHARAKSRVIRHLQSKPRRLHLMQTPVPKTPETRRRVGLCPRRIASPPPPLTAMHVRFAFIFPAACSPYQQRFFWGPVSPVSQRVTSNRKLLTGPRTCKPNL